MSTLSCPCPASYCKFCGSLVPKATMLQHLEVDVWMLRVIKATHPEIDHRGCKVYLRALRCPN